MSQQENNNVQKHFYRVSAEIFNNIQGSPISYWMSQKDATILSGEKKLGDISSPRQGLATSDDQRFLRFWHEVSLDLCALCISEGRHVERKGEKWVPFVKGGAARRWYGNNEIVINWWNDGEEVKEYARSLYGSVTRTIKNIQFYLREMISWSLISGGMPSFRLQGVGQIFGHKGPGIFSTADLDLNSLIGFLNSKVTSHFLSFTSPNLSYEVGSIQKLPILKNFPEVNSSQLIKKATIDWDSFEGSWDFISLPILNDKYHKSRIDIAYQKLRDLWWTTTIEMQLLEEENNRLFIEAYGLQDELTPEVPLTEITLTCNPHYRYGVNLTDAERETRLQSDTIAELISYAIGCMMGRYSLDREGLVYAHAGNEGFKALVEEGAYATFAADEDGILPLTADNWFPDDVAARFEAFVRTVWGAETLEENLAFIADSLCLAAIKPVKKGGETARETIRRYLSTQFFKDHMKTYKKRPIYWLFSSGKEKAFECLVYLHRYNEATLPRMRTEYVTPLLGQMAGRIERKRLEQAEADTAQAKRIGKEIDTLSKQLTELRAFDDELKHHADMRITLDLDDGVKVNYGKFGTLLSDVKAITGDKGE
ncbi:BREX-1 system adenine-specific DNA-methyltransferase PglX [Aeromonas veronii]